MTIDQALSILASICTSPKLDYGAIRMIPQGGISSAIYMARCSADIPWDRNEEIGEGEAIAFFGNEADETSYVLIRETATKGEIEKAMRKCVQGL